MRVLSVYGFYFLFVLIALPLQAQVTFNNITSSSGLLYYQQSPLEEICEPPLDFTNMVNCGFGPMTGGIATADYNNDGLEDIFVTRMRDTDILFKNNGDGTFSDVTIISGLEHSVNSNGAIWSDVDNDGDLDLFISTLNEFRNYFYLNNGNGTFTENALNNGLALATEIIPHTGWSIAAGDYDHDGFLDFFIGEWESQLSLVPPETFTGNSKLLRNKGIEAPGYFEDATNLAMLNLGRINSTSYIFSPVFVDIDQHCCPR